MTNQFKTIALLASLTALLALAGNWIGGRTGFMIALLFGGALNLGAWWFSDKFVLRMHRAQPVGPADNPKLYATVQRLSLQAGLPAPALYVIPEEAPNAFATGRSPRHGVVAVSEGLLRLLPEEEVEGVVAHELAHIKNRDTLIASVAAAIGGSLSAMADMALWGTLLGGGDNEEGRGSFLGILIAPVAAFLIQMAISRAREFEADAEAARITGNPMALASALQRIEAWSKRLPMQHGSPSTSQLFIQNPIASGAAAKLFSTHPPTGERVARLAGMLGIPHRLAA
jgi:heat shock protein HtpX